MRILCVDDESLVLNVTSDLLRDLGHDVCEATDANQALIEINKSGAAFDLLVTDIRMPGLDGLQLAQFARATLPDLPIIYFSAYSPRQPHEDRNSMRLTKPCSLGMLNAAIVRMTPALPQA